MTERTCGTCSLCCFTLGVKELEKPARQWCKNCDIGADHACRIYDSRPQSCRDFKCLWLSYPNTPEAMKPRTSGVVCWVTSDGKHAIALTRQHDPIAWRKPAVIDTLRKLAKGGLTVIAFSGVRAWLVGVAKDEEFPIGAVKLDGLGLNSLTITPEMKRRVAA